MNIPKKLNIDLEDGDSVKVAIYRLEAKINERIDLQAKEEATIIPVGCFCTKKHSTGEASKGEGKLLKLKPEDISGEYDYKVDIKNSLPIPKEEKCNCKK